MNPRVIPSIEQLRRRERVQALEARYGHAATIAALRDEAAALRDQIAQRLPRALPAGRDEAATYLEAGAERRLQRAFEPSLRLAINATGVVVHTNLGRAPLASPAIRRVAEIAGAYTNLEYDVDAGRRGARDVHAEALLARLTGAEAAVVVNNNAAATMLLLAALAAGREVIISRGELVEIGGGFRVPDVMAQSGAILREVGTTNKTRAADYAAAIGPKTGLVLRVHPSNFRIEGFTERPTLDELVALGRKLNVPIAEDLGSGNLGIAGVGDEPIVGQSLATGADVVCFSGDKLLGGPQAGILVGRREWLQRIRTHPLMRALRVDKMTYAALEATLLEYAAGRASETVPVARMIALTADAIGARARALSARLVSGRVRTGVVDGWSTIGGGSAPGSALPTRLVVLAIDGLTADALEERLRRLDPPVIARIDTDRLVLDLRTVLPEQDALLARLLEQL